MKTKKEKNVPTEWNKKTGETVAISLLSIDVGFDVRSLDLTVMLPRNTTSVQYHPRGTSSRTMEISGGYHNIVMVLRAEGYKVKGATPANPPRGEKMPKTIGTTTTTPRATSRPINSLRRRQTNSTPTSDIWERRKSGSS